MKPTVERIHEAAGAFIEEHATQPTYIILGVNEYQDLLKTYNYPPEGIEEFGKLKIHRIQIANHFSVHGELAKKV